MLYGDTMKLNQIPELQTKAFLLVLNDERLEPHNPSVENKLQGLYSQVKKQLKDRDEVELNDEQQEFAVEFLSTKLSSLNKHREAYDLLSDLKSRLSDEGQS